MTRLRTFVTTIAIAGAVAALPIAAAAATYPDRPVKLVVPFAPGATTDILARLMAEKLAERWKQPVIVENKAGAGSLIGADFVAKSAPDGYTLLFGSESLSLLPHLQTMPFDWRSDLVRVSLTGTLPILLTATGKRGDLNSMVELVAYAKANPGKLNYGSPGKGTVHHLTMELFAQAAGIKLTHVPYKGAGPALQDLVAGTIEVMPGAEPSAKGQIQAGNVRALAVFAPERIPGLPNVPTAREAGVAFEEQFWWGMMAPGKTPPEIVQQIADTAAAIVKDPETAKRIVALGVTPVGSSAAQFEKFFVEQNEKWGRIVKSLDIKLE